MRPSAAGVPPGRTPVYRRLFHLLGASVFPVLLLIFPKEPVLAACGGLLGLSLAGEVLRLRSGSVNRWFLRWFKPLLKPAETGRLLGSTWVLGAATILIWVFSEGIAALALMFNAIGDPLAAIVGERLGKHRFKGKSIEGSAAYLAGGLATGTVLLAAGVDTTFCVMAAGAATATLLELAPLGIDDNLLAPLGSGGLMLAVSRMWG